MEPKIKIWESSIEIGDPFLKVHLNSLSISLPTVERGPVESGNGGGWFDRTCKIFGVTLDKGASQS